MQTKYYLRNTAHIGNIEFPAGYPIAVLATPDGIDQNRIISALANGLVTTDAPKEPAREPKVHAAAHPLRPAQTPPAVPAIEEAHAGPEPHDAPAAVPPIDAPPAV